MAMTKDDIHRLIQETFPDAQIDIQDLRGDGDHYAVTITSVAFEGKTRVEQHQMVYRALGGRMGNELHALAIKTRTP